MRIISVNVWQAARDRLNGTVKLRGLEDRNYSVVDYVTGKNYGMASGHSANLPVEFDGHLLLEVQSQ